MRYCTAVVCSLFVFMLASCGGSSETKTADLLGKWQVYWVNQNGNISTGPSFKGTSFTFRDNGKIFGETANGDTNTVSYEYRNDSIYYKFPEGVESYGVDSLTDDLLQITLGGAPVVMSMKMKRID